MGGLDTRRLTRAIRQQGAPHVALAHNPDGKFDLEALVAKARAWRGLVGLDLARDVTCAQSYRWDEMRWAWPVGYSRRTGPGHRVVAIDYGAKRNILRCLASAGCDVTVLPASATAADVLALNPDGVFLSNGPGDPAATGAYAVPMIRGVLERVDLPLFGICLGHQMLALALGARTVKMNHGHHGANHPVKDLDTGKVEITSMNHGFTVDSQTLPAGVLETHVSLFDGSNCGIRLEGRPVFSVQYHPEASPGPQDSYYLFERFAAAMQKNRAA
jgi:carbamoyl-phosphate synthase small subunit